MVSFSAHSARLWPFAQQSPVAYTLVVNLLPQCLAILSLIGVPRYTLSQSLLLTPLFFYFGLPLAGLHRPLLWDDVSSGIS